MIKLICVGKIKEKYLMDMVLDYNKRINKYHKFNIIEVKDSNIEQESKEIIKNIGKNEYIVALAIEGKQMNSLEFASFINETFNHYSCITFFTSKLSNIRFFFLLMTTNTTFFRCIMFVNH